MPNLRRRVHSQGRKAGLPDSIDVVFEDDNVHYTCCVTDVKGRKNVAVGNIHQVKWSDGKWYPAKIVKIKQGCSRRTIIKTTNHRSKATENRSKARKQKRISSPSNEQLNEVEKLDTHVLNAHVITNPVLLVNAEKELPLPDHHETEKVLELSLHDLSRDMCKNVGPFNSFSEDFNTSLTECSTRSLVISSDLDDLSESASNELITLKCANGSSNTVIITPSCSQTVNIQQNDCFDLAVRDGDNISYDTGGDSESNSKNSSQGSEKLYSPSKSDLRDENDTSDSFSTDCKETPIKNPISSEVSELEMRHCDEMLEQANSQECESITDVVVQSNQAPDIQNLTFSTTVVHRTTKTEDGKRKYDKFHYCMYCKLPQKKISRHVMRKHKDEVWVEEALKEASGSKERKIKLEQIRNRGDWLNNDKVLTIGKGNFIAWKSPSAEIDQSLYLSCEFCNGAFLGSFLWKHLQTCRLKVQETTKKNRRVQAMASMLIGTPVLSSDGLRDDILLHMNYDRISLAVKNDKLIIAFGEKLYHKLGHDKTQHQYIAQKMRELGRLSVALRDMNKNLTCLTDVISPTEFNWAVAAVKVVTGYNPNTASYKIPSLALKLGHSLNKCAALVKYEGLTTSNINLVTKAEQFKSLMDSNWSSDVSSHALTTLGTRHWNKPLLLPMTHDVVKYTKFLTEKIAECKSILQCNPNTHTWYELAKVVLAQIILFNRRRSGETSKILLTEYNLHIGNEPPKHHDDVVKSLSELEKQLVDSLFRLEVRGKKGKKVPVLLTADLKLTMDYLNELRSAVGVDPDNPYVFAKPFFNSQSYIRGHDCLKELAIACGVENPEAFTSTRLRKQLATIAQLLNLKGNELDMLANFLGHNIDVHREYYRLPENTLQVAKIGKILMNMQKGNIHEYAGKSLDEVQVTAEDAILSDSSDESTSEESDEEDTHEIVTTEINENPLKEIVREEYDATNCLPEISSRKPGFCQGVITSKDLKETKKATTKHVGDKVSKGKQRKVCYWNDAEISAVQKHLGKYLILNKLPGKKECEECLFKERAILKNRQWQHLKFFIKNKLARKRICLEKKNKRE